MKKSRIQGFALLVMMILVAVLTTVGAVIYKFQTVTVQPEITNKTTEQVPFLVEKTSLPVSSNNAGVCDCAWAITTTANVEFLITDPDGLMSGFKFDSNSYVLEIPDSSYGPGDNIADPSGQSTPMPPLLVFSINKPKNGIYTLQVIGKESGDYQLQNSIVFGPFNGKDNNIDSSVNKDQVQKYLITIPELRVEKVQK